MENSQMQLQHQQTDRMMLYVLFGSWLLSFIYAFVFDTYLQAFLIGALIVVPAVVLIASKPGQSITRHVVAMALLLLVALHVQQLNGMVEAHFGFFVVIAILFAYKDWQVFVTCTLLTATHHLLFYYFQLADTGILLFDPDNLSFLVVLQHAFYVVVECTILAYQSRQSHQESGLVNSLNKVIGDQLDFTQVNQDHENPLMVKLNTLLGSTRDALHKVKSSNQFIVSSVDQVTESMQRFNHNARSESQGTAQIAAATEQMVQTFDEMVQHANSAYESVADRGAMQYSGRFGDERFPVFHAGPGRDHRQCQSHHC